MEHGVLWLISVLGYFGFWVDGRIWDVLLLFYWKSETFSLICVGELLYNSDYLIPQSSIFIISFEFC